MIYSNKLKEIRLKNSLSQEDIASILNIERGTYGQYETEYIIMPLKHLNYICNYFNISLDYIFSLTNTKENIESQNNIDKVNAGLRLKEFRKENKLTQVKLAELLNPSILLSQIMKGEKTL